MKKKETRANHSLLRISPWVIAGSFIIMAPILAVMTIKDIQTQQDNMIMLLTEKGAALIRSFEAGTRTGMGMNWSGVQVQRLIMETAEQPDILYILITDQKGTIVAHNLPMNIGKSHGTELEFSGIKESIQARQLLRSDGKPVFEVYRRFIPSQGRVFSHGRMMSHDWFYSYFFSETRKQPELTIFVGLDMDQIVETNRESASQSIMIAIILLLLGLSGIISIVILQNYRSARASLSRIKAFSDNIVENMPVGLLFIGEDGKIMTLNDASERMLLISPLESIGRQAGDLLPAEIVGLVAEVPGGDGIIIKEIQCSIQGKITLFEASAGILKDDENTFLGHIILLRDISEIAHLKKEVQQRERLASLGSLAAGIAHEIRNPLSSIKGFATYFKERYRDVPEDQKTADVMIAEVERLNRVISQLLEFARPMNVQRKEVCINDIVRHALDTISSQAGSRNIRVERQGIPKEAVFAFIDPDKLGQVLLNIFLNAMEAMEQGGTLSVSIREDRAGDTVSLEISDTGHGIPREDISRVFDPYYTTKQSGTGLGLAIVHKIVEAHGAQIQVQSSQGKGTCVTITLPAHKKG